MQKMPKGLRDLYANSKDRPLKKRKGILCPFCGYFPKISGNKVSCIQRGCELSEIEALWNISKDTWNKAYWWEENQKLERKLKKCVDYLKEYTDEKTLSLLRYVQDIRRKPF